ncbi:hypothetical protein TNCT_277571 [Trichonephila clavata]|uniref:Uncharacterized protein n=1 Tax=Trichonephila clavata TaxID=2740835 RepID=A0A8X6KR32_TRICU|nr:hypothetical protein TNCT_277571 [Trichonephila clavata]
MRIDIHHNSSPGLARQKRKESSEIKPGWVSLKRKFIRFTRVRGRTLNENRWRPELRSLAPTGTNPFSCLLYFRVFSLSVVSGK